MRGLEVIPWPEAGCWALVLGGKLVTAGSQGYCEAVAFSSPPESLFAALDAVEWVP